MFAKICAHLRYHFRITPRQWDKEDFSEEEILVMYGEFLFVKGELGEIKKEESQKDAGTFELGI